MAGTQVHGVPHSTGGWDIGRNGVELPDAVLCNDAAWSFVHRDVMHHFRR